jgi:hypothetical protein
VLEIEDKVLRRSDETRNVLQSAFSKYLERYVAEHKPVPAR